jgi:hypothetical protein
MYIYWTKNYIGDLIWLLLIIYIIFIIYISLVLFFFLKKLLNSNLSYCFIVFFFNFWRNFIKFFFFKLINIHDIQDKNIIYLLKCIEEVFLKNHCTFWNYYKFKFLNIGLFASAQNFQFLNFDRKLFWTYYMYNFVNTTLIIIEIYTYYFTNKELMKFIKYIFLEITLISFWLTLFCITYFILKKNVDIIYFHKIINLKNKTNYLIFKEFLFFLYLLEFFDIDNFFLKLELKESNIIKKFHEFLLFNNFSYYTDYADTIYYNIDLNILNKFILSDCKKYDIRY